MHGLYKIVSLIVRLSFRRPVFEEKLGNNSGNKNDVDLLVYLATNLHFLNKTVYNVDFQDASVLELSTTFLKFDICNEQIK